VTLGPKQAYIRPCSDLLVLGGHMAASATVKFQVTLEEKAKAERIAAELGLSTGAVMRVLFKRFVAYGGFPDQLLRVPVANSSNVDAVTSIGLSAAQIANLSRNAGQAAAKHHLDAGRPVTYATAEGTLVREHPNGELETL
jgi:antitoxin component of RelBE/YafQ-DinJ toxin-antitoxin module